MTKLSMLITLIVGITFAISCNKTTTKETPTSPSALSEKTKSMAYPHEKEFYKSHGSNYMKNKEQCLGCHGGDGSGGTANVSCLNCHKGFPHPPNWVMPGQHPGAFANSPQSCVGCHGEDYKGGKSKVSCLQCHEGYPHPMQWAKPDQHGKAYVDTKDKKQCMGCHDPAKPQATSTRCDSCHKAFPHEKGFINGNRLHRSLSATYEGKCLNCHRDYKENMPNSQDPEEGIGCMACHEGTIKVSWLEPTPTPKPTPAPEPETPTPPATEPQPNSKLESKKADRLPTSSPHKKSTKKIKKYK